MANKTLTIEKGTPVKRAKNKKQPSKEAPKSANTVEEKHTQPASSSKLLFCVCVLGIFTSYLIYGLIQEAL